MATGKRCAVAASMALALLMAGGRAGVRRGPGGPFHVLQLGPGDGYVLHDPDAPTSSGFWHWAVYNIPPTAMGLALGAGNTPAALPVPAFGGMTDLHDAGVSGGNGRYGGPCPPVADRPHRYVFTLYALAVDDLHQAGGIPRTGTAALHSFVLNKALGAQLLEKASFTATYGR